VKTTRRDLLAWGGGAVAGLLLTPIPWKTLDDVSIWTQNWPWIPQPARGPVEVKATSCTLCAGGCGMRVRMAAGAPVGIAGAAEHPLSQGALCPLAFGAHQLNAHPSRLRHVMHRGRQASWEEAAAAFRKAMEEGPIAIVDGRAGRAASTVFEKFAAAHGGIYAAIRTAEERSLTAYERWSGVPASALGYDLENARTILSFGAPLLDGWGTPGRFTRLWSRRDDLRLIQVEAEESRTAVCAGRWVKIRPGSESAVAGAIARVLIEERLVAARGPIPFESDCGLDAETVRQLAHTLVERGPALAIASDDNPSVAALNVILGGRGIVRRGKGAKAPMTIAQIPSGTRAIVIDSTVPLEIEPQIGAEVFRFAAWDGGGSKADWLLPAPGFLEALTDVPTPPGSAIETYALAAPLVAPLEGVRDTARFLAEIDPAVGSVEEAIQARCEAIHEDRDKLLAGAVWTGATAGAIRCDVKEWPRDAAAPSRPNWTAAWTSPVLPPLAGKLFQESNLREAPARRHV
jgi:hypothetical protein